MSKQRGQKLDKRASFDEISGQIGSNSAKKIQYRHKVATIRFFLSLFVDYNSFCVGKRSTTSK